MPEKWTPHVEEVNVDFESHKAIEASEGASFYPELIGNEPLVNTTLVYSVPVMGEWQNGNLLRFLRSVLAQRVESGESFEVELLFNSGRLLELLQTWDNDSRSMKVDANGNAVLDTMLNPEGATQLESLMLQSDQAIEFMRKVVDVQLLSRTTTNAPEAGNKDEKLKEIIESESDLIRRQILQLASDKAGSISIAALDLTRKSLQETPYHGTTLSSLRTLGADIAASRFNENPDLVLNLFDVDTIMASNDTAKQTQATFGQYPDLNYLFLNMTNAPAGVEQGFVADSPRSTVVRTAAYGREVSHGSPQIAFRLRAYQKLKELSEWMDEGFTGHEDSDTAMRLAYHFGQIQDGLLFESGFEIPVVMTGERLDGTVDSVGRKMEYEQLGVQNMAEDIGHVYDLQDRLATLMSKESPEQQEKIQLSLQNARHHFKREQQVQQRFNRIILKNFIAAVQAGDISVDGDTLRCNDAQVLQMRGGEALLHYVKSNTELITDILLDAQSINELQSCLDGDALPNGEESPFYLAVREYIGEVRLVNDLVEEGLVTKPEPEIKKYFGIHEYKVWHPEDRRTSNDRVSFMHSMVAETFAVSTIYKMYFEKNWAKNRRENWNTSLSSWPENPDNQQLNYHFPDLDSRLRAIQQAMNTTGREVPHDPSPSQKPLSEYLQWKSIPMSKLLNRMKKA